MVETITSPPQEKMEMFSGHSAERIEPILGITPEPFDPVDVIPSPRSSSFLSDQHMVPLDTQRIIRMPVIRVVQAARLGVGTNQLDALIPPTRNVKSLHLTVVLQNSKYDNLAGSSPRLMSRPV